MKKNKAVYALVGAGTLLASPCAFATLGSLYITAPGYTPDQAGPYTVQIIGASTIGQIYTGSTPPSTSYAGATEAFQTFCIASTVDYSPNTVYNYSASQSVQPFTGENQSAPETFVTWGAAYLYNAFLHNPSNPLFGGTGNNAANDALQEAIWSLQKQSYTGITLGGSSTSYLNTVSADFASDLAAASSAATAAGETSDEVNALGAFGVEALNMTVVGNTSSYVQPQLVELGNGSQTSSVPEPSTVFAGVMLLLPLGVGVSRALRRNRNGSV